jgi:hypothetical protein
MSLDAILTQANDTLTELASRHLKGSRASEADFDRIWSHLAGITSTLAIMQAKTPREICEQAFAFCPTDERWREELLARRRL